MSTYARRSIIDEELDEDMNPGDLIDAWNGCDPRIASRFASTMACESICCGYFVGGKRRE
jgi:hypothetical protein